MLQITEPDFNGSAIRPSDDHLKVSADQNTLGVVGKTIMRSMEFDANDELCIEQMQREIEDGLRCATPIPDYLRIEEDQADAEEPEDEIPEEPKKSFFTNATERTRNLQHKLSTQASHLRTKFRRNKKPKVESPKTSPRNSLQATPNERKRFRGPEFSKLKNIHMPKISKPEFKRPEFTKFKRTDFKINLPEFSKVPAKLRTKRSGSLKESTVSTGESIETGGTGGTTATEETPVQKESTKKRFEFTSYPKFLERFRKQSRDDSTPESKREADDEGTPPIEFNTVPRASKPKSKGLISTRWGRKQSDTSYTDNDSGKYERYNSESGSVDRETSLERRMRVALKNSVEDEEEPLGILQTDEQKQLAEYDEENRAIHQISKARKDEFERRKPLVHQESDLISEVSNRDFDWAECEQLRESLVAERSNDLSGSEKNAPQTEYFPSNISNQETQSSGSSGHRQRANVIEEIDDDEFFLRRKGLSQDNIEIGQYISSAIRDRQDDDSSPNALAQLGGFDRYYDENFNISNDRVDYGYDVPPPRKPKRFTKNFNKSLESEEFNQDVDSRAQSFDEGHEYFSSDPNRPPRRGKHLDSEVDSEVPVSTEYYPRYDDDDGSFYENEQMEGIEQPNILVTNIDKDDEEFDSHFAISLARQATPPTPPKAPKRRRKGRDSIGRDSAGDQFKGRSVNSSYVSNGNNEEVNMPNIVSSIYFWKAFKLYFMPFIHYSSLSIAPNTIISYL